ITWRGSLPRHAGYLSAYFLGIHLLGLLILRFEFNLELLILCLSNNALALDTRTIFRLLLVPSHLLCRLTVLTVLLTHRHEVLPLLFRHNAVSLLLVIHTLLQFRLKHTLRVITVHRRVI